MKTLVKKDLIRAGILDKNGKIKEWVLLKIGSKESVHKSVSSENQT